jgi:hypothetical protein
MVVSFLFISQLVFWMEQKLLPFSLPDEDLAIIRLSALLVDARCLWVEGSVRNNDNDQTNYSVHSE